MFYVIYRKRDRLIVGTVEPRRTDAATRAAVEVELSNIAGSELGGLPADYAVVETHEIMRPGTMMQINDRLEIEFLPVDRPDATGAADKLRRLGFTDSEIALITNITAPVSYGGSVLRTPR